MSDSISDRPILGGLPIGLDGSVELGRARVSKQLVLILIIFVASKFTFQALFVPAYEGPDEPLHLARVVAFADRPLRVAFDGEPVDGSIAAGIAARPCGPALHRFGGCRSFGNEPAAFNLLKPLPKLTGGQPSPNPENNQPPLFYFLAGMLARFATILSRSMNAPEQRLLVVRLLCVGCVLAAFLFPLRRCAAARPYSFAIAGLLVLTFPGAAEALARCANDAPVFLWSAVVVASLPLAIPMPLVGVLLAIGPLLKQTAFPVAAFAVVWLWCDGRRRAAVVGALSAGLVFPVQLARGWRWGGNYELNRPLPAIGEAAGSMAVGIFRSLYTFLKTVFWLGEWTFFRAPLFLVVIYFLLLMALIASSRPRSNPRAWVPHLAGAATALVGLFVFIVANRRYFGGWGGVGGWYLWSWTPWIAVAWNDCFEVRPRAIPFLIGSTAGFSVVANWAYFVKAFAIYG